MPLAPGCSGKAIECGGGLDMMIRGKSNLMCRSRYVFGIPIVFCLRSPSLVGY